MERSGEQHEAPARYTQARSAPGRHDLAVLGQSPASIEPAVRQEIVARDVSLSGPVNTANILKLLERQQHQCALTGRSLTPDTASLDHIVPIHCGGQHQIENTQVLHKDVNRAKSTMTNEEFIRMCKDVAAWNHQKDSKGGEP